ncbi:hypothetical protein EV363DRAFT_1461984 [Boletus edulis]|nr:hypothetical protein EV363DRAFT_1461984 [Boletus edulis]
MPLLQVLFLPAPSGDWSDGNDSAVIDVDGIGNPDATNKDPKDVPMSDTIVEADPAVQLVVVWPLVVEYMMLVLSNNPQVNSFADPQCYPWATLMLTYIATFLNNDIMDAL